MGECTLDRKTSRGFVRKMESDPITLSGQRGRKEREKRDNIPVQALSGLSGNKKKANPRRPRREDTVKRNRVFCK